jgi:hypothetical protein
MSLKTIKDETIVKLSVEEKKNLLLVSNSDLLLDLKETKNRRFNLLVDASGKCHFNDGYLILKSRAVNAITRL